MADRPRNGNHRLALATPTTPTPTLPQGRAFHRAVTEPWSGNAAWSPERDPRTRQPCCSLVRNDGYFLSFIFVTPDKRSEIREPALNSIQGPALNSIQGPALNLIHGLSRT